MNFIPRPSATVTDVAKAAGVSVGTVSRVLNGHQNITQTNLARVQKAIKELGYEKCRSAEQLVSRRNGSRVQSGNIGMVYAEVGDDWANHPLIAAYSMGVERACQETGYHAMIEFSGDDASLPRCVRENKVDGLLIKTTRNLPAYVAELPPDFPVVSAGLNDPSAKVQQVAADDRGAGWLAAEYLWEKGHRRIGFVCPDAMHPMFLARMHGCEAFLQSRNAFDPELFWTAAANLSSIRPEVKPSDQGEAVEKLLNAPGAPITAILTANDWTAHGVYSALARAGRRVGKDISVMGFDNAEMICTSLDPQLTSFSIPFHDVAYVAAMRVIEKIRDPSPIWDYSLHLIRGEVIERGSSGAPFSKNLGTCLS